MKKNNGITFYLTTGYTHSVDSDIIINPTVKLGKKNAAIFKLPLSLKIDGDKIFVLPDFKIFNAKTTNEIILYSLSDASKFIDKLSFGNTKDGFYLIADRDQIYSNSLFNYFNSYSARNSLSLNLGFNLDNDVGFDFYVDNLELPRILSLSYDIAPIGGNNPIISMLMSSEMKIKDNGLDFIAIFNASITSSFINKKLETKLFFSSYIKNYDDILNQYFIQKNSEYAMGLELQYIEDNFKIPLHIGFNKGKMRSYVFDAFSYVNFTSLLDNKKIEKDMYLSFGYEHTVDSYKISTNYEIHNLLTLNTEVLDRLYLSLLFKINDFDVNFSFIKNNLTESIAKFKDINSYLLNKDTILSIGLNKNFEHLTWSLKCSTSPKYELDNKYINMLKLKDEWDFSISVFTSLRF